MPLFPGAEPYSADGGSTGVLLLHGFTGSPKSMKPWGERMAAEGHTVRVPRLPGHGTRWQDMNLTRWEDWYAEADRAFIELQKSCERVFVFGLSMGGSLTCWLATRHPELAGIICINPAVQPDPGMVDLVAGMVEGGMDRMDAIGNDVADPEVVELAYDQTPLPPLLTMFEAASAVGAELGKITSPMLLMTSPQDHVVPPTDSDVLAAAVSGPVERVSLDRSFHVATIDYDRDLICRTALEFVGRVTA